jgi:hypothetical protein
MYQGTGEDISRPAAGEDISRPAPEQSQANVPIEDDNGTGHNCACKQPWALHDAGGAAAVQDCPMDVSDLADEAL